jgi:lipocalin
MHVARMMLAATALLLAPTSLAAPLGLGDVCLRGLPSFPINVTEYAAQPWFEVASSYLPYTYIEAGCSCVQAHYTANSSSTTTNTTNTTVPGEVGVRNFCWLGEAAGGWRTVAGTASPSSDPERPGDLTVRFPNVPEAQASFSASPASSLPNYIVANVWAPPGNGTGEAGNALAYAQALVIGPCRAYAWVLSRTPEVPEDRWTEILAWMAEQGGLDLGDLQMRRTVQLDCPPLPPVA